MPRKDERPVRTTAAAAARERNRSVEASTSLQRLRSDADVAFVDALARLLREHDLAEIELTREYGEDDELHVRLSRYAAAPAMAAPIAPVAAAAAPALAPPAAAPAAESDAQEDGEPVTAPIVGTVYMAPEPGAAPFIKEGDRVEQDQPLLIIEAMKVMNQIPSPRAGVVKRILVADAQPVEFGSPLVILE